MRGPVPTSGPAQQPELQLGTGCRAGTFLSLIANEACEAIRAEAVEGGFAMVQQTGPAIQAQAGVTEVT